MNKTKGKKFNEYFLCCRQVFDEQRELSHQNALPLERQVPLVFLSATYFFIRLIGYDERRS